ncbi:MAG: hypothetical protein EZS28_045089, partial [Streblomastix strix]
MEPFTDEQSLSELHCKIYKLLGRGRNARVYLVDPGSEVNISAAKVMNNEEFIENEFVVATMIT